MRSVAPGSMFILKSPSQSNRKSRSLSKISSKTSAARVVELVFAFRMDVTMLSRSTAGEDVIEYVCGIALSIGTKRYRPPKIKKTQVEVADFLVQLLYYFCNTAVKNTHFVFCVNLG